MVYDGKDIASPYITPTLQRSGTFTITCYVTDTRDRTQSDTLTFTVQEYTKPTMSDISCYRCDAAGNASDSGTRIYVKAATTYSSLGGANAITLRVRYKTSAGSYSSYISLDDGAGKIIGDGQILTASTYVVEISLIDSLGNPSLYTGYIPLTEEVFLHGMKGGRGAALGKYAELPDVFDVAWSLVVRGDYYGSVMSLGNTYQIQSGDDINNYTDFGVFSVTGNATAEKVLNLPVKQAGRLIVSSASGSGINKGSWVYIQQEYLPLDGTRKFTRLMQTNGNGEWSCGSWYVFHATQFS